MDDYRQIEMNLICGVLDAIPNPTVLLNRDGQAAYVNPLAESLPVSLETLEYGSMPQVQKALEEGKPCPGAQISLTDGQGHGAEGFLQIYPVYQDEAIAGALLFFHPAEDDPTLGETIPSRLPYVSQAIEQVWERIGRLSGINASVLFTGETGVGRESFARALHERSGQRHLPFVAVDCLPSAGGLTGLLADDDRCRQAASAGVCYFDGIEALPHEEQLMLLNIIREKKVGGHPVTARLCYSAPPDLEERSAQGEFSSELVSRVSLLHMTIPPLRERPDDIPPIARHFIKKYATLYNKPASDFTEEVWQFLIKHDWPLNLKDMDIFIGESVLAADGPMVTSDDIPFAVRQPVSLRRARHRFTYARIDALLAVYGNTTEGKRRAAKELGIGLSTLYRLLAKQTREKRRGELS